MRELLDDLLELAVAADAGRARLVRRLAGAGFPVEQPVTVIIADAARDLADGDPAVVEAARRLGRGSVWDSATRGRSGVPCLRRWWPRHQPAWSCWCLRPGPPPTSPRRSTPWGRRGSPHRHPRSACSAWPPRPARRRRALRNRRRRFGEPAEWRAVPAARAGACAAGGPRPLRSAINAELGPFLTAPAHRGPGWNPGDLPRRARERAGHRRRWAWHRGRSHPPRAHRAPARRAGCRCRPTPPAGHGAVRATPAAGA